MDNCEPLPPDLRALTTKEVDLLWDKVLSNELDWSKKCFELSREAPNSSELFNATRCWWSSAHKVLQVYTQAQVQQHRTLEPFPGQLLMRLGKLTYDLGKGIVPQVVGDVSKGKPGRPVGWTERRDIAHAIFYVQACKSGEIADRAYNMTVRDTYNVTASAVQKWMKDADLLCAEIERPVSPEAITRQMRICGTRYARIGRGAPSE